MKNGGFGLMVSSLGQLDAARGSARAVLKVLLY